MTKAIYFDMDGTIADLYGVDNWLDMLIAENESPYEQARPMLNLNSLVRVLKGLQKIGYHIGIVSWGSKNSSESYLNKVTNAKMKWLDHHMASFEFDEIAVIPYGTPKSSMVKFSNGILFDDEQNNRDEWQGTAYDEKEIIQKLLTFKKLYATI